MSTPGFTAEVSTRVFDRRNVAGATLRSEQNQQSVTPQFCYRFPNLSAEKEFAQATGRTETAGKAMNVQSEIGDVK